MPILSKSRLRASQSAALYVPVTGGGGGGVTWADPTANVALSGGNLVATALSGAAGGDGANSTTTHTAGKYYVEVTFTNDAGTAGVGIFGSTFAHGSGAYMGINTNSICYYTSSANVFYNNNPISTWQTPPFTTGSVWCMAIDLDNRTIWGRQDNGPWNNDGAANPSTNTAGLDISAFDPAVYFACEVDAVGSVLTLNSAGPFTYTAPSGFIPW